MIICSFLILFALFIVFHFRLYLHLFPRHRLIILMYHQIKPTSDDDLTVSLKNIEQQMEYLATQNFKSYFFKELPENKPLRKKSIIITFDDGYQNNYTYLLPILEKYQLKATIFIATKFVEKGYKHHKIMSYDTLKKLPSQNIEIALHTHSHHNIKEISPDAAINDILENMQKLEKHNIPFTKALAYPYGRYYKNLNEKKYFFSLLNNIGIKYATRIGNKNNFYPTAHPYELCRIDIRGNDNLHQFKKKLFWGKLKLF